jgi:hypothetical protein
MEDMPGAVANTSTFALNNATLPFVLALPDKGYKKARLDNPHLLAASTYTAAASPTRRSPATSNFRTPRAKRRWRRREERRPLRGAVLVEPAGAA